ncbi:MAG: cation diffusion facilitator family transporter [Clostridia bacterium]|nr:cation diffusion facilitator family transporter [Clostridia bacterium]
METKQREKVIVKTSVIGILANVLIAAIKIVIGLAAASLAIVSEGINNASDALSSVITLIGAKLSGKHPDENHPFGYGRIEYMTGLVIGVVILAAGLSLLKESITGIIHPEPMSVTVLTIVIVAISAVGKLLLGMYTKNVGKKIQSDVLIAVGEDSRNDSILSVITIISAVVFLVFGVSIDAYAGLLFSVVILKTAFETLKNTSSDLIGRPGKKELARQLYKEIRATEGIISVADMMLHDYGPDRYSGSVNVEIDHNLTVGEAYEFLHALQLRIMHEHGVTMVFGIYAVDSDSPNGKDMRGYIARFVRAHEHVKSFHALYLSPNSNLIYVDLIVDYQLEDWDALREEFLAYMKDKYPANDVELTIETEFV